ASGSTGTERRKGWRKGERERECTASVKRSCKYIVDVEAACVSR
ncbi:unnamed protein product, partial [Tetraodon nigroviridis]